MKIQYYSEYKQDQFLDTEIFGGKNKGVFVEVGAGDGIKFSNSFFFERSRNWSGLCIEPRASEFQKLITNRTCKCENICISNSGKPEKFAEFTGNWLPMLSGIERTFYDPHKIKVEEGLSQSHHHHTKTVYEIPSITLQALLDKYGMVHVDYCSIDTEGCELEVLQTIDFNKASVNIFSIENNYNNTDIPLFMKSKGYELITELGVPEVALDQIYKKC